MTKFTLCHPLMLIMTMCFLQGSTKVQGGEKLVSRPVSFVPAIQEPVAQQTAAQESTQEPKPQPEPPPEQQDPVPLPGPIPQLPSCPTTLICEIFVGGECVNKVFRTEDCQSNSVSHITFPCVQTLCSCTETGCLCTSPGELGSISPSGSFSGYRHFGSVRNDPIDLVDPAQVTVNKTDASVVVDEKLMNISINGKVRTLKLITITFKVDTTEYKANVAVEVKSQSATAASGYSVEYMENSAIIGKKMGGTATDVYPVRLGR